MIKIYYRNLRDKKIQQIDDFRVGAWVHVEDPTEEELQIVKEKFNLDEGLLRDATDQYEVPRMEVEDEVSYIFSRYPYSKNNRVSTSPILFILADKSLISISKDPFPLLEGFLKRELVYTTQKTKLFIQLFALMNNSFNTYLHSISRETRSSTYELEKISNKDIAQSVNYEQIISDFHLALVRTNVVLKNLLSHKLIRLFEEDRDLI